MQKRAAKLRSWLFNRKEEVVVVVSHGCFLHALTEDWNGFNAAAGELIFDIALVENSPC